MRIYSYFDTLDDEASGARRHSLLAPTDSIYLSVANISALTCMALSDPALAWPYEPNLSA
jgi:hypothetical protein